MAGILTPVFVGLAAYLVGAIPTGYIIGRLCGFDIRNFGSGGTGATNVGRKLGVRVAALVAAADFAKGVFAVWLGNRFGGPGSWVLAAAVVAAVAGHAWPVYIGFRGGKSVATGGGAMMLLFPWATLIALAAGAVTVAISRYVSLGSMVAAAVVVVLVLTRTAPLPEKVAALGAVAIVVYRHEGNIRRLLAGTENRIGAGRA